MERPWLFLGRVLTVDLLGDDDDLHGDADEHAVVGEAEADDAQLQEEEHAGVGEAEEHVSAAVGAALEAQDEQKAAVGEADVEEENPLVAQLQESVVNVNTDAAASEAAHGAGEPEFTIDVAPLPWFSILFADRGAHPDPERPDMYPYIIATGRFCLLVHFAIAPSYGTNFDQEPNHSHLVVVRHFRRDDDGAQIAARAVRVPDRPDDDLVNIPALSNIDSVGLVCNQETGHYQIAELIVNTGAPKAVAVYIGMDTDAWKGYHYVNPLMREDPLRDWVPHGTVTINSTFLWYDLSWGIISCDLAQPRLLQLLDFHRLPPGRVLSAGPLPVPDLHCRRCIAVSENLVRYVEIILNPPEPTTVNMWYRDLESDPWRWKWNINYTESFEDIWDDESYQQAGLPRNIPMLVGVSPVNSSVVYFSLDQRLFGVNVPEHTVVHCEEYDPLDRPGPDDEPVTSRYLITWNLDADEAPNVGHRPDEPSDHGDSSPGGPAERRGYRLPDTARI